MIARIKDRYSLIHLVFLVIILLFYMSTAKIFITFCPDIGHFLKIIILLAGSILMQFSFFIYILIIMRKGGNIKGELKIIVKKKDILWGMVVALVNLLSVLIILPFLRVKETSIQPFFNSNHYLTLLVYIIFFSFYAPFVEELVFRGFIWKIFEEKKINNIIILFLTSFLFALFHFEIHRFPIIFTSGMILGLSRMLSGRIGVSIVGHMTNNFLYSLSVIVLPKIISLS